MKVPTFYKPKRILALSGIGMLFGTLLLPLQATAAVTQPTTKANVSFTFDDGLASALTAAAPTLAAHGLTGTDYIITGCTGMTTVPNTCAADTGMPYMSWDQIASLQNTYGWEIGGHTVSHPQLATDNLTDAQLLHQIADNKADLLAHGYTAPDFASPYGDYDNRALAMVSKYYQSHRGFWDIDNNVWPYANDYVVNNMQVQAGVTVAQVEARIDAAIANKQWLVLTFHEIRANANTNPTNYQYKTADLDAIAAYVQSKKTAGTLTSTNIKDGLVTSTKNAFLNGGFDSALSATGWHTDNATAVTRDTANNGSYVAGSTTGPTNSIKLTTTATQGSHLFSPLVPVDSTKQYMIKNFLNLTSRTSGEMGYYIDEYDAAGNWVSGQWKKAETTPFVKEENIAYTPSSSAVKQASLQIYADANSGIVAYLDNFQMFALDDSTVVPTPPTDPVDPGTGTNAMPNGNFDAGVGTGWTSNNSSAFVADATNNGATENPVNSIKLTAPTTGNASLFAPKMDVESNTSYTIKAFLKLLTLTSGELGFYVDEYDTAGNWISGKYITGQRSTMTGEVTMNYVPSSANVKKAGLQIILVGNSGITGFLDNVQWIVPGGSTPPDPDPTPVDPTPPATTTVMNETFATGMPAGWTADSTFITADANNNGATDEAAHSIKMVSESTKNIHLFAPSVAVTSTKTYAISSYLNITNYVSGEVAYYIDEYDAAGNWVSGKYVTGIRAAGSQTVTFNYVPTSANVAKASLQVIVTANSGITAYIDSISITTAA